MPKLPESQTNTLSEKPILDLDAVEQSSEKAITLTIAKRAADEAAQTLERHRATIGAAFAAQSRLGGVFADMARAHEQFAKSLVPTFGALEALKPTFEAIGRMAETLVNNSFVSALKAAVEVTRRWQAQFAAALSSLRGGWLSSISLKLSSLAVSAMTNILPRMGAVFDWLPRLNTSLFSSFEWLKRFLERLRRSDYYLIVRASEGDELALHELCIRWRKLQYSFNNFEANHGHKPSTDEFKLLVQSYCWQVLKENESKEWLWALKAITAVFCALDNHITKLYLQKVNEHNAGTLPKPYMHEGKPHYFIKDIAAFMDVSEQAVRNWIRAKHIPAIKIDYFKVTSGLKRQAYIIPDTPSLTSQLRALKLSLLQNQKHRVEGYYTTKQLAHVLGVNEKTIRLWAKKGVIQPSKLQNRAHLYDENTKVFLMSKNPAAS